MEPTTESSTDSSTEPAAEPTADSSAESGRTTVRPDHAARAPARGGPMPRPDRTDEPDRIPADAE